MARYKEVFEVTIIRETGNATSEEIAEYLNHLKARMDDREEQRGSQWIKLHSQVLKSKTKIS